MQNDATAAVVTKSVTTGIAAAFGVTWWAAAAALIGAAASLYFERGAEPSSLARLVAGILIFAFIAALIASALPHVPLFGWSAEVNVEVRAGLLGVFAQPIVRTTRRIIEGWKPGG